MTSTTKKAERLLVTTGKGLGTASAKLSGLVEGGSSGLGKMKDKVTSNGAQAAGGGKRLTVIEDIDIGVPVREAYDQWTQFQEFSAFAGGVEEVEQTDDSTTEWRVKILGVTRSWQGEITEQIPDERIAWTSEGGKGTTKGVVTFHPLGENLTRVLLVLEYYPKGLLERTGALWRAQGRRARLDLKNFRRFVMLRGEASGQWRGEIRDCEVVTGHEHAVAAEEEAGEGSRS